MKIKTVFLITSILSFLFGLGFLITPGFFCRMLDFAQEGDGPVAMRFAGILILGISILVFRARYSTDIRSLKIIATYLAATYSMMLIFHLVLQIFFNIGSILLWAVDALHLAFALYYWIFAVKAE